MAILNIQLSERYPYPEQNQMITFTLRREH